MYKKIRYGNNIWYKEVIYMFERKEPFQWKIPILILTGILVLSGGIYIGVKTRKVEEKPAFNNETINEKNEETKDSFG